MEMNKKGSLTIREYTDNCRRIIVILCERVGPKRTRDLARVPDHVVYHDGNGEIRASQTIWLAGHRIRFTNYHNGLGIVGMEEIFD